MEKWDETDEEITGHTRNDSTNPLYPRSNKK